MRGPIVITSCKGNRGAVDPRTVRRRGQKILNAIGRTTSELSILLCDDSFIKELNREYRGKNRATDVLSFPMITGADTGPNPHLLGDVVISVETAARQAKKRGIKLIDEVSMLLVHGVLHLVGYTHDSSSDSKLMTEETNRIQAVMF